MLARLVPFCGCAVKVNTVVVKVTDGAVAVKNLITGEHEEISADTVILAIGFESDQMLFDEMRNDGEVYNIGDSRQFKNVHQAIWDAYEVANHI